MQAEPKNKIKVPFGQPIACHEDPDGVITVYVKTDEEMMELYQSGTMTTDKPKEEPKKKTKKAVANVELLGEYKEFQDPHSHLMDSTNMHLMMDPHVATRTWQIPYRRQLMVKGWDPSEDKHMSSGTPLWCWYDCHPFNNRPFRLPWSEDQNGKWTVMGYFCSPACARAYNQRWSMGSSRRMQRDTLIHKLAMQCYGYSYTPVNKEHHMGNDDWSMVTSIPMAPDVLLLKEFGGPLDIDQFREYNKSGCEMHLSLEYPYVIIPQIAVEHKRQSPKKKQRRQQQQSSFVDNSAVYIQSADTVDAQRQTMHLAPCCADGTKRCRKTFAEAKKKEQRQEPAPVISMPSVLAEIKKEMWQKKQKQQPSYACNSKRRRTNKNT